MRMKIFFSMVEFDFFETNDNDDKVNGRETIRAEKDGKRVRVRDTTENFEMRNNANREPKRHSNLHFRKINRTLFTKL